MSDEAALLAAIRDNPDEDTPRLIYADWLDDQGGESNAARAEFIRVQVELARMVAWEDEWCEARADELLAREKQLFDAHRLTWLRPTEPAPRGFQPGHITFRRGFAEEGFFRTDELREYASHIRAYPLLRSLQISAVDRYSIDGVLELPWLEEVRCLELIVHAESFGPPDWAKLGSCERFQSLRSLELGFEELLTRDAAERIASNPTLRLVQRLRFWEQSGQQSVAAMLSGSAFGALESLEVYNRGRREGFPPDPLPDVTRYTSCARLRRIKLNDYSITASVVEELVRGECWSDLRDLELGGGEIKPEAIRVLGRASAPRLQTLCLGGNALVHLNGLCGPLLGSVRHLSLTANHELTPAALRELAGCDAARGLRCLDLSDCYSVGDAGAEVIAASAVFAGLERLDLINTELGPVGALALAESPHLRDDLTVILHGCHLDDRSRSALRARFGERVYW